MLEVQLERDILVVPSEQAVKPLFSGRWLALSDSPEWIADESPSRVRSGVYVRVGVAPLRHK